MACCNYIHKSAAHYYRSQISPVEKASRRQQWKDLHAIADKMLPKVRDAFIAAISEIKDQVSLKALEAAAQTGDVNTVLRVIDDLGIENKFNDLTDELRDGFEAAGIKAIDHLPKSIRANARFDLLNPRSVRFLRNYNFNLIQSISNEAREGIRSVIITAFEEGGHPYQQAKEIKQFIGLTARQQRAVNTYSKTLEKEGRAADQIKRMTERYYQRQLKYRATNIARTETIRAANIGQNELWNQLADDGLIERSTTKKIWVVTDDDRLCPICEAIPDDNADGVPIDGDFDTDVGPLSEPPAHPQCRCALALDFED